MYSAGSLASPFTRSSRPSRHSRHTAIAVCERACVLAACQRHPLLFGGPTKVVVDLLQFIPSDCTGKGSHDGVPVQQRAVHHHNNATTVSCVLFSTFRTWLSMCLVAVSLVYIWHVHECSNGANSNTKFTDAVDAQHLHVVGIINTHSFKKGEVEKVYDRYPIPPCVWIRQA